MVYNPIELFSAMWNDLLNYSYNDLKKCGMISNTFHGPLEWFVSLWNDSQQRGMISKTTVYIEWSADMLNGFLHYGMVSNALEFMASSNLEWFPTLWIGFHATHQNVRYGLQHCGMVSNALEYMVFSNEEWFPTLWNASYHCRNLRITKTTKKILHLISTTCFQRLAL